MIYITEAQKASVIIVTVLIGIAIIGLGFFTNCKVQQALPKPPDLTVRDKHRADSIKIEIENYKAVSAAIRENKSYLNELLVVNLLKPVFNSLLAGIVTFIFGGPLIEAIALRIKGNKPAGAES